jgi:hypothetical protein
MQDRYYWDIQMSWATDVACVWEKGDAYRVLVGKPGRKGSLGT